METDRQRLRETHAKRQKEMERPRETDRERERRKEKESETEKDIERDLWVVGVRAGTIPSRKLGYTY